MWLQHYKLLKDKDMKTVIIDNYDSFTYNLLHLVAALGSEVDVLRNDAFALGDLAHYDRIILSPGPGIPDEAGLLKPVIEAYASSKPILGVCLGHQAIGEVFGGTLINLDRVFHGVQTPVVQTTARDLLFDGLNDTFDVGRYHSWVVDPNTLPDSLEVTAVSQGEGQIMALRHKTLNVRGIQFHPESILTPEGKRMMGNWLQQA